MCYANVVIDETTTSVFDISFLIIKIHMISRSIRNLPLKELFWYPTDIRKEFCNTNITRKPGINIAVAPSDIGAWSDRNEVPCKVLVPRKNIAIQEK